MTDWQTVLEPCPWPAVPDAVIDAVIVTAESPENVDGMRWTCSAVEWSYDGGVTWVGE